MPKKQKEELPSFLHDLKFVPEEVKSSESPSSSYEYSGPIFFLNCENQQSPFHLFNLASFHHIQHIQKSKKNLLDDIYFPKAKVKKQIVKAPSFQAIIKKKLFFEPCLRKNQGKRKNFVAGLNPHTIDFGETSSVIEGEKVEEIPFYHLKKVTSSNGVAEVELITLSDLREKNLRFMSYKNRIAHAHYPKQFTTVRVIGPTIPASITITRLPSKRKRQPEIDEILNAKEESGKDTEKKEEKVEELEEREVGLILPIEEQAEEAEEAERSNDENVEAGDIQKEEDSQELNDYGNPSEIIKESVEEVKEDAETEQEEMQTENQGELKMEEVEEQKEENSDEEQEN